MRSRSSAANTDSRSRNVGSFSRFSVPRSGSFIETACAEPEPTDGNGMTAENFANGSSLLASRGTDRGSRRAREGSSIF